MDRGTLWWTEHNGWGLTRLSVRLIEQGIRLSYGRICHPQMQGKVERFHRTLGIELRHRGLPERWPEWPPLLAAVRREYDQGRPHEALGMRRPAEVYRPSRRGYQEQPREWEYPAGSDVRRLNRNGLLREGGRQWSVCESLGGHRVRIEYVDGRCWSATGICTSGKLICSRNERGLWWSNGRKLARRRGLGKKYKSVALSSKTINFFIAEQ